MGIRPLEIVSDPFPTVRPPVAYSASETYRQVQSALSPYRQDGWANETTGLGTARDKLSQACFVPRDLLSFVQCSILFHSDDVAFRIATARPEEMMRAGYRIKYKDDDEMAAKLRLAADKLDVDRKFFEAMVWGGVYGGSAIVIGARDFGSVETPLREESVQEIKFLTGLDRRYIWPEGFYTKNGFEVIGMTTERPEIYSVCTPLDGKMSKVHESRLILFGGALTDLQMRRQLNGWDISVFQRAFETLQSFGTSFSAIGNLIQDASQGVFEIKDLHHLIANDRQALLDRMALVDAGRSSARAVLLEAETEKFTRVATSFASLPELLDRIMQRMSAATRIPVTLLMGRSAAGMNATGDSDFRAFYDSIKSEQQKELKPRLLKVYRLLVIAEGGDPDLLNIEFLPLWEPTEQEKSQTENQDAQRDVAMVNAGIILPEEAALRIARGARSIFDTVIDVKAREASLKIELEMLQDEENHIGPADEMKQATELAKAVPGGKQSPQPGSAKKEPPSGQEKA